MRIEPIYVIGAGGHAKVVIDALLASGTKREQIEVSDNDPKLTGSQLLGFSVQVPAVRSEMAGGLFHIAIGAALTRNRLTDELIRLGARPLTVYHPASVVASSARVGQGAFIAARAIIGPDAYIGDGVIVNHGAVVDHDVKVGQFCHVAPNATLAGAVSLGERVLIGAGANVLPGVTVADDAVVGAGAVVLANVVAGTTCVGVPAVSLTKV